MSYLNFFHGLYHATKLIRNYLKYVINEPSILVRVDIFDSEETRIENKHFNPCSYGCFETITINPKKLELQSLFVWIFL